MFIWHFYDILLCIIFFLAGVFQISFFWKITPRSTQWFARDCSIENSEKYVQRRGCVRNSMKKWNELWRDCWKRDKPDVELAETLGSTLEFGPFGKLRVRICMFFDSLDRVSNPVRVLFIYSWYFSIWWATVLKMNSEWYYPPVTLIYWRENRKFCFKK